MPDATGPWRWKVAQAGLNEQLDLLYEPGNWGDVLKGAWAVEVMGALLARRRSSDDAGAQSTERDDSPPLARDASVIRLLDPWAGAPTWPLVEDAAERLASLADDDPFVRAQEPFLAQGRLASTGRLLRALSDAAGCLLEAHVYDASPARRAAWDAEPGASVLALHDGADALAPGVAPGDLTLVDPYDLFETAETLLPRALARRDGATLFYLYNKAPRGAAAHRQYERLRDRLSVLLAPSERRLLVGRIPSDARLPRAYHEMLLVADAAYIDAVREPLRARTLALAGRLASEGAFEDA